MSNIFYGDDELQKNFMKKNYKMGQRFGTFVELQGNNQRFAQKKKIFSISNIKPVSYSYSQI